MSAPIGRPAATWPSTGRRSASSLPAGSSVCCGATACSTRIPRARPGTRSIAPAASSASRWYCAARTPLKPNARAISICEGGMPSASMRSAISARISRWVCDRSASVAMAGSITTNSRSGQLLPKGVLESQVIVNYFICNINFMWICMDATARIRRHGYHLMSLASFGQLACFVLLLWNLSVRSWDPQLAAGLQGADWWGYVAVATVAWLAQTWSLSRLRAIGKLLHQGGGVSHALARAWMQLGRAVAATAVVMVFLPLPRLGEPSGDLDVALGLDAG